MSTWRVGQGGGELVQVGYKESLREGEELQRFVA